MPIQSLCVFCGSSMGNEPTYRQVARRVGSAIAARGWTLVYGGGNVGLMGHLADAVLEGGGRVIGVIPRALLDWEVGHPGIHDLRVVESMHERKAMMADLADGFLALPGGFGTLEELFEVLTWSQLGFHQKPIGLLQVDRFFDPLLGFLDSLVATGFLRPQHRELLLADRDLEPLLGRLAAFNPRPVVKWIERENL